MRPVTLTRARRAILGTVKIRIATVQTVVTTTKETATQTDSEAASQPVDRTATDQRSRPRKRPAFFCSRNSVIKNLHDQRPAVSTANSTAPGGVTAGTASGAFLPPLLFREHDFARRVLLLESLHLSILHDKFESHVGETGRPKGCTLDPGQRNDWLAGQNKRQATVR